MCGAGRAASCQRGAARAVLVSPRAASRRRYGRGCGSRGSPPYGCAGWDRPCEALSGLRAAAGGAGCGSGVRGAAARVGFSSAPALWGCVTARFSDDWYQAVRDVGLRNECPCFEPTRLLPEGEPSPFGSYRRYTDVQKTCVSTRNVNVTYIIVCSVYDICVHVLCLSVSQGAAFVCVEMANPSTVGHVGRGLQGTPRARRAGSRREGEGRPGRGARAGRCDGRGSVGGRLPACSSGVCPG